MRIRITEMSTQGVVNGGIKRYGPNREQSARKSRQSFHSFVKYDDGGNIKKRKEKKNKLKDCHTHILGSGKP